MVGSLFREWKVAATFVGGIAIVVAVFFSDGGGYEQLDFRRKVEQPAALPAPSPSPQRPASVQPVVVGGFTSDAELEAQFASPSEAATSPPSEQPGAVPEGNDAAPAGIQPPTPLPASSAAAIDQQG